MLLLKITKECDIYRKIREMVETDEKNYREYIESLKAFLPEHDEYLTSNTVDNSRGKQVAWKFKSAPDRKIFKMFKPKEYEGFYTFSKSKSGESARIRNSYRGDSFNYITSCELFGLEMPCGRFTIPMSFTSGEDVYIVLDDRFYKNAMSHGGITEVTREEFKKATGVEFE